MMDNFSRYRTPAIFGSILPAPRNGDGRSNDVRRRTGLGRLPWPIRMPRKPLSMARQPPAIQSTTTWLAFRQPSKTCSRNERSGKQTARRRC
jgi:hypothetical protein